MGNVKAYILLITSIGKELDVVNDVKKLNGVKDATPVYGEYDVVVEVEAPDLNELNKTINQIRRNSSIIRTVTLISM
ncbi:MULTISPECIES: Lrp/AsnC ligand binding domain-containing protein [Acidianus]|jgi:DNA-binding Lrp family transcriptional regulator|uniref:Lrp/AsnC family transcriptional regulator n=3 Tax=Acidianus TaxID=12914 RepID=A0A650CV00_ACIAM|nr:MULTISPECIES: Lrp/AsnC ligand binding domain-containing protein [Acidianus]AEE95068.1 regulatory protein AsnC/Lrp family [Acidianus hospitalis W1]MQL55846.1 Lrp/AsnC family transcriptional regulator [Acidianus ambivalens]MUM65457.1 Lrp/AsnC family transcriptional regulator [Acidianus infernus]QGR21588.1 Lrp/AsnC family transcriptional regulator [Acidianus ambivalens]